MLNLPRRMVSGNLLQAGPAVTTVVLNQMLGNPPALPDQPSEPGGTRGIPLVNMGKKRKVISAPPGPCGKAHTSALKAESQQPQLYAAFSAAYDGCVDCVRKALDDKEVHVDQRSDSAAFDLMQWAAWGNQEAGNDTTAVQELLLERGATRQPDGKRAKTGSAESTCSQQWPRAERRDLCAQSHTRACDATHTGQPYLFFSAAFAGCPQCVRRYIEEGGDAAVQCHRGVHNALGWAELGKREGQDTDWVIGYLEGKGFKRKFEEQRDDFQEPIQGWQAVDMYGPGAQMVLRPPLTHIPQGSCLSTADRRGVGWGL